MVDEVAWGIGWGEAGDATPPPDARPSRIPSRSTSRSGADPRQDTAVADDVESPRPSRIARSRSRPAASARTKSRSASRHAPSHPYDRRHHHQAEAHLPPMQPSFSALTNSILRASSTSSSASNDSAVLMTPSHSHDPERERGRLPRPKSHWLVDEPVSRSLSPLEQPLTPSDSTGPSTMGGRKGAARVLDPAHWTVDEESGESQQSVPSSRSREPRWNALQGRTRTKSARHGSMPPAPSPSLSWTHACDLAYSTASTPRPIAHRTHTTRSKSVDPSAGGATALTRAHARGL
ncbi:hypothetical protein B0H21DRAFT_249213 [Amylocystis lapponica]|nr:hypothetical protein B0H21DRAFT_249213 [Amylocystis lapponica]